MAGKLSTRPAVTATLNLIKLGILFLSDAGSLPFSATEQQIHILPYTKAYAQKGLGACLDIYQEPRETDRVPAHGIF